MGCGCIGGSSGGGGCLQSGCGCTCSTCCPPTVPCDPSVPETCVPLGNTTDAARLVVEDSNACKKTMASVVNSLLYVNADGSPVWSNGSTSTPICLPSLQTQSSGTVKSVWAADSNGCLRRFTPLTGGGEPAVQTLYGTNSGDVYWAADTSGLPNTCGLFYRDCDTSAIATLSGSPGEIVTFNADGTPIVGSGSGLITAASRDGGNLTVVANNSNTLLVNVDYLIVRNAANELFQLKSVSETINRTITGAGGIDTGSVANSTFYYLYIIYNPTTASVDGLMSTNPTTPTLPPGYTYYRKVGAQTTNSSAQWVADGTAWQSGNVVYLGTDTFQNVTTTAGGGDVTPNLPMSQTYATIFRIEILAGSAGDSARALIYPTGTTLVRFGACSFATGTSLTSTLFDASAPSGVTQFHYAYTEDGQGTLDIVGYRLNYF